MQRTKLLLRPVRQQQTLVPRALTQAASPLVQRRLMREMQSFMIDDVIPELQDEYSRNQETRNYNRTGNLHDGWNSSVNYSHGAIVAVLTNHARESSHGRSFPRYYWAFVQGPNQNQDVRNISRWRTVEQVLSGGFRHGSEDVRERTQRIFNSLLGV